MNKDKSIKKSPDNTRLFVSARSLSEYIQMFNLTEIELRSRILDCASGAASFTAELASRNSNVVAADPLYSEHLLQIRKFIEAGIQQAAKNVSYEKEMYNWIFPASIEEHLDIRSRSARLFLEDYLNRPNSYKLYSIDGQGFPDNYFDIALCSHFLFVYGDLLSRDDHLRAIVELTRVARVVRIFPIVGFKASADQHLEYVISECEKVGIACSIRNVRYNFLQGTGRMLEASKLR